MRKVICMMTVLLLCVSLVMPAFAQEDEFVPSITYKPEPEIVPVQGEDGKAYIGVIRNADGEIVDYIEAGCLVITPVAHIWDDEEFVTEEVEDLLLFVYNSLFDGSMTIPYEKHLADLKADNMVIRDLFDARWGCEEHGKMVEPEGVTLDITFDLGIMDDVEIFVMTYDEETKEWEPIVKTVNNGDGTVTCTFEHLCAIEFSMPLSVTTAPVDDVQQPNILPWIIVLAAAVVAVVALLVFKKKKAAV